MFLICGEALYDFFLAEEGEGGAIIFDARPGGSPFNVSVGMARLGAASALLTGISNDMLGERLARVLSTEGVTTDYLVRTPRPTTLSLVGVDETGGPSYAFYGAGSADTSLKTEDLPHIGNDISGLHVGSFAIAVTPVADALATLVNQERGRFISLDPNVRPTIEPDMGVWRSRIDAIRPLASLVKVSDEDLAMLYPEADPLDVVRDWAADGPDLVILTQGGNEAVAVRDEQEFRVTPPSVKVENTVGAGDTFMASLLAEISANDDPKAYLATLSDVSVLNMMTRAATAAAITCERRGADMPHAEDLAARL